MRIFIRHSSITIEGNTVAGDGDSGLRFDPAIDGIVIQNNVVMTLKTFRVDLNDVDGRGFLKVRGVHGAEVGELIVVYDPDDETEVSARLVEILPELDIGFADPACGWEG